MGSRLTWPQICRSDEFRGRWVALDRCKYDPRTAQPTEGTVVDADEDLVALCSRMQASDSKHCAILFCEERVMATSRLRVRRAPRPPRPSAARLPLASDRVAVGPAFQRPRETESEKEEGELPLGSFLSLSPSLPVNPPRAPGAVT